MERHLASVGLDTQIDTYLTCTQQPWKTKQGQGRKSSQERGKQFNVETLDQLIHSVNTERAKASAPTRALFQKSVLGCWSSLPTDFYYYYVFHFDTGRGGGEGGKTRSSPADFHELPVQYGLDIHPRHAPNPDGNYPRIKRVILSIPNLRC